jgi:transposase
MAYREVPVFEVREVMRLWLDGRGYRPIAGLVRPDRKTVTKVIEVAVGLGLDRDGGDGQLDDEFVGSVIEAMRPVRPDRHGESWALIAEHHDKVAGWVTAGDVPERKMCELLERNGVFVPERTLNRYIDAKFPAPPRSTVRVVDGAPGAELQVDFGELGMMFDEESGRRRKVWALVFTAAFSRHTFVWLSFSQKLATVIAGFEEAWIFFGGVFKVVIPDNMATTVTNADACDPTFNQAFVEYAQSRGFVIDPARVRSPQDKPRVERTVAFVQGSFWAGENFGCLAEAQVAAELWCRVRAGLRDHGTTHRQPVVVFNEQEAPALLPAPRGRYDLPVYQRSKVHPDRHIQVFKGPFSPCRDGSPHELSHRTLTHRGSTWQNDAMRVWPAMPISSSSASVRSMLRSSASHRAARVCSLPLSTRPNTESACSEVMLRGTSGRYTSRCRRGASKARYSKTQPPGARSPKADSNRLVLCWDRDDQGVADLAPSQYRQQRFRRGRAGEDSLGPRVERYGLALVPFDVEPLAGHTEEDTRHGTVRGAVPTPTRHR